MQSGGRQKQRNLSADLEDVRDLLQGVLDLDAHQEDVLQHPQHEVAPHET